MVPVHMSLSAIKVVKVQLSYHEQSVVCQASPLEEVLGLIAHQPAAHSLRRAVQQWA